VSTVLPTAVAVFSGLRAASEPGFLARRQHGSNVPP
jgi:hypothetical protein